MKKSVFFVLGTLFLSSLFFSSCKEEDNDENEATRNEEKKENPGSESDQLEPGKLDPVVEKKLATKTYTYNGVSFKMIYVEGGTFMMGAQPGDNTLDGYDSNASWLESPVHKVTLTSYAIGETEVTQEMWKALSVSTQMDISNRPDLLGDKKPMFFVTRQNALDFVDLLNSKMHRSGELDSDLEFALTTEAQWEFAAKGGVKSKHYYYSGSNTLSEVAETNSVFGDVKQYMPNELGIYDMTGNACELTLDYWSSDGYITTSEIDPVNDIVDDYITYRGGVHGSPVDTDFRITNRMKVPALSSAYYMSFRLALVATQKN